MFSCYFLVSIFVSLTFLRKRLIRLCHLALINCEGEKVSVFFVNQIVLQCVIRFD